MCGVTGNPASDMWIGNEFQNDKGSHFFAAHRPTKETQMKRLNVLKSLVSTMAQLQNFHFDKMAMIDCDEEGKPFVGPYYAEDGAAGGALTKVEPCPHTRDLYQGRTRRLMNSVPEDDHDATLLGYRSLFTMVYNYAPFDAMQRRSDDIIYGDDAQQSFALTHLDLDFQNIFTDDDGNVTGLIDWDKTLTVPRYVGYASIPLFLRKDYEYYYEMDEYAMIPWVLEHYRQRYAQYMAEALAQYSADNDSKYTSKPPLYHTAHDGVGVNGKRTYKFVAFLTRAIPGLWNADMCVVLERLGSEYGWYEGEMLLFQELPKLFAPEPVNLAKEWDDSGLTRGMSFARPR